MGEKTEKATPKKLRDARKKGQVAKSQDVPGLATFLTSIGLIFAMSSFLYGHFYSICMFFFKKASNPLIVENHYNYIFQVVYEILLCSLPFAVGVAIVGALINFLMVGPMFATEVFKFDIKKFDPINNLKQKFKLRTLVELLKSTLKVGVVFYISYRAWWETSGMFPLIIAQSLPASLFVFSGFLWKVIVRAGVFFFIVAMADFLYQRKVFNKEMMMEKFEVKQEFKNTEGDPELKSRRKEIAREVAYGGGPRSVKGSKVVVTNPTHIAVALAYEHKKVPAPFVLAKGKGLEAEWMIREAKKLDIPIVRNVNLAWSLYEKSEAHEFVPVESYEAVAEILRWVASLHYDGQESIDENLKETGV